MVTENISLLVHDSRRKTAWWPHEILAPVKDRIRKNLGPNLQIDNQFELYLSCLLYRGFDLEIIRASDSRASAMLVFCWI